MDEYNFSVYLFVCSFLPLFLLFLSKHLISAFLFSLTLLIVIVIFSKPCTGHCNRKSCKFDHFNIWMTEHACLIYFVGTCSQVHCSYHFLKAKDVGELIVLQ